MPPSCNACSAKTTLLLLSVAGFDVSQLSAASATWLAAAVIRSGGSVTVSWCSCTLLVSSHNQAADILSAQLLLAVEPSCGTSVVSGSTVELALARLQGSKLGPTRRYEAKTTLHQQMLCRRFLEQHQRNIRGTVWSFC